MPNLRSRHVLASCLLIALIVALPRPTGPARLQASLPLLLFESSHVAPLQGGRLMAAGFTPFPQWNRVRRFLIDDRSFRRAELRPWVTWAATLRRLPVRDRLEAINDRVRGRLAYVSDEILWQRPNYWETPIEVVRQGATDCEGFAIFKMFLAIAAGVDRKDMAILVGRIPSRDIYHAVLLVRENAHGYVLDSRWRSVNEIGDPLDFAPLYAVDTVSAWSFPTSTEPAAKLAAATP